MESEARSLRTDVYDQLKVRLFTGELRPGQFVSQRELVSLLGATLNPVREAIRQLEAEGLINVYAQRGIQIVEGGPKAINDAYAYRRLLELSAVRHFAETASADEMAQFRQRVEKTLAAIRKAPGDRAVRVSSLEADYRFHKDIVDFQNNEIMSKHYSLNAARLRLFRVNMGEPLQRQDVAAVEHLDILAACTRRNADKAVALLGQHIEISREHTLGLRPMRAMGGRSVGKRGGRRA